MGDGKCFDSHPTGRSFYCCTSSRQRIFPFYGNFQCLRKIYCPRYYWILTIQTAYKKQEHHHHSSLNLFSFRDLLTFKVLSWPNRILFNSGWIWSIFILHPVNYKSLSWMKIGYLFFLGIPFEKKKFPNLKVGELKCMQSILYDSLENFQCKLLWTQMVN